MSEALTDKWRIRYKTIEKLLDKILLEKEKLDCEHVKRTARTGCCCRRCKAARSIHD